MIVEQEINSECALILWKASNTLPEVMNVTERNDH